METRKLKLALSAGALALSLALAGCGGGGSAQMPADPPPPTPYEVAQAAIMTADTKEAAEAAVATAVEAGITGAQLQSLNMAVATRSATLADAAAMEARQMLVNAAMCTEATEACVEAHDKLIAALQADLNAVQANDGATNAEVQAAREALEAAQTTRQGISSALAEIDRSTATGSAVGMAVDAANALETARTADDIQGAEALLATAEGMLTESDDYAAQIAGAKMAIARAKERNMVDQAVMAAQNAATGLTEDSSASAVTNAQGLIADANTAIDEAMHLTDAEKTEQTGKVQKAQETVTVAKQANDAAAAVARAEEERKAKEKAEADAKMARALLKALDPMLTTRATNPLPALSVTVTAKHNMPPSIAAQTTLDDTATDVPNPKFADGEAADAVSGGWSGWQVTREDKTNEDAVVVYSNIDAPTLTPFAEVHDADPDGKITVPTTADTRIVSTHFAKTGLVTHKPNSRHQGETEDSFVEYPGTYQGASGRYTCDGASCTSQRGSNGVLTLGSGWSFTADQGAMVSVADSAYQHFGWWLRKDNAGMPAQVHAFAGGSANTKFGDATAATVVGKAKFDGAAAGKYAINDPLPGNPAHGGHWTASVSLTADFDATLTGGTESAGTIEGMIDNFMAGGMAMPWSVELKKSAIGAGGAADHFSGGLTVWTIDGRAAAESGGWMGSFYDDDTNTDTTSRNDGLPSAAAGTFNTDYGTAGRMTGAFGVSNSAADTPR